MRPSADVECFGGGGYADFHLGTQVVVKDGNGSVLAVGEVTTSHIGDEYDCEFGFEVPSVPEAQFYSVAIAERGELTYTLAELEAMEWRLELFL